MYQVVHSVPSGTVRGVTETHDTGAGARERHLEATIEYVAEHGVGELTLRRLASALGTSHRMLLYHFGSREGLLIEVIRALEERQRAHLAALELDPGLSVREAGLAMWDHLADPALWPYVRLFFELYGQALQGRPHAVPLLDGIVDDWLGPLTELGLGQGLRPDDARAGARLSLAVVRGLLLDLLATGDREAVDAAFDRWIVLYEGGLAG